METQAVIRRLPERTAWRGEELEQLRVQQQENDALARLELGRLASERERALDPRDRNSQAVAEKERASRVQVMRARRPQHRGPHALKETSGETQFIVIAHSKKTMVAARLKAGFGEIQPMIPPIPAAARRAGPLVR